MGQNSLCDFAYWVQIISLILPTMISRYASVLWSVFARRRRSQTSSCLDSKYIFTLCHESESNFYIEEKIVASAKISSQTKYENITNLYRQDQPIEQISVILNGETLVIKTLINLSKHLKGRISMCIREGEKVYDLY